MFEKNQVMLTLNKICIVNIKRSTVSRVSTIQAC